MAKRARSYRHYGPDGSAGPGCRPALRRHLRREVCAKGLSLDGPAPALRTITMKSLPNNWITRRCRLALAGQEEVESITRILAENQETLTLLFPEVSPEFMAR